MVRCKIETNLTCLYLLSWFSTCEIQVLGSGFEVISVGKKKLVRSVPTELNKDHNEILELAQVYCHLLNKKLLWTDFFIDFSQKKNACSDASANSVCNYIWER